LGSYSVTANESGAGDNLQQALELNFDAARRLVSQTWNNVVGRIEI
jgi:YD repeat-containing protein